MICRVSLGDLRDWNETINYGDIIKFQPRNNPKIFTITIIVTDTQLLNFFNCLMTLEIYQTNYYLLLIVDNQCFSISVVSENIQQQLPK